MRSPLKDLRLSLSLTIDDVIERSGISRSAIMWNEAGCYSNPSPRLLDFYEIDVVTDRAFLDRYHEFQFHTRRSNFGVLRPEILASLIRTPTSPNLTSPNPINVAGSVNYTLPVNPVMAWRVQSELSKARISKAFCIHPDIVSRIECRPHLMPVALPEQFLRALLMAGYRKTDLESLNGLFRAYRNSINSVPINSVPINDPDLLEVG